MDCIPYPNVQLSYTGQFVKCPPNITDCETGYVLTVYGELFYRETRAQPWVKINTPNKYLFRTKLNIVFQVDANKKCICKVCPTGEVFDISEKVLYQIKNKCWIPIQLFNKPEKRCDCAVVPFDAITYQISIIGKNPKVLPGSQIPSNQVTFNGKTAVIDVENLPIDECVLLRYGSELNCQKICVDYFLIKCSPQTNFCDPIACTVDITCDGIFPCPAPTGDTLLVPMGYATIQAAIDAANPGDLILVDDGTYIQNLLITTDNLTIRAVNNQAATIQRPDNGLDAIVRVESECAVIEGFNIQGPFNNSNSDMIGVHVTEGGSAEIRNNNISAIRRDPLNGIQQGTAIRVDTGSALIENNVISDYQKNGITINNESCGIILNNQITGAGPTDVIAQNGIQISRGSTGLARGNTVSDNIYTPFTVGSTDVLLFQVTGDNPVCAENNTLTSTDYGVALASAMGALIQENTITNTKFGIVNFSDSVANIYINNVLNNNSELDIFDDSVGLFSAGTGNAYLCNECETDNLGGAICSSTSPLNVPGPRQISNIVVPNVSPF